MPTSGFVALIGRSNVGKSTLLNALVGSKVAITTPKPQTTRYPIHGIISEERGQIVFVDTPGVMQVSRDALTKKLISFAAESLKDVDAIVYVVDPSRAIGNEEHQALEMIAHATAPKILVINKIDYTEKPFIDTYRDMAKNFDTVIEVSALRHINLNQLKDRLFEVLPEGEPFYPEGQLSSLPHEVWVAELIREKLFMRLRKEVPYSIHVEVVDISEKKPGTIYIAARILLNEARYKGMVIGKGGVGLTEVGQSARKELEGVLQKKVFIDLNVEVDPHWVERLV